MPRTALALLLASTLSSCKPAAPPPAPPPPAPPAGERLPLMERLTREAKTRPAARDTVRPEAVAAALAARGRPLERWKQVLASPIGARYCMNGATEAGNVVAVCEFGSVAEAEAGLAYSRRTFDRLIPNRTLVRNAETVLTVTRAADAPAAVAEVGELSAIFASL